MSGWDIVPEPKQFPAFLRFQEGENTLEISKNTEVRTLNTRYGQVFIVKGKLNGEEGDILLTTSLASRIKQIVMSSKTNHITVKVIRVGQGRATRYSIKT
jgi:hypothetical protein